jgi:NADH-quinone oxidoreductase subunit M
MTNFPLWLGALAGLPALTAAASRLRLGLARLRRVAIAAAAGTLLLSLLPAFSAELRSLAWPGGAGGSLLRVNALSAALLPLGAGLWLLTVAVTPGAALDRAGQGRAALATLTTLLSFLTANPAALVALQAAAVWIFLSALRDPAHLYQRRIVAGYLGASTALLGAGAAGLAWGGGHPLVSAAALGLVAAAALLRKGIVPFHAWVPEVFDHGRLGPAILFCAPQVGAYITAVLIVPRASPGLLRAIALLALLTAVYGAALALAQQSARRACGYLFMSQSALVMAGLDCTSTTALAGGLLVWLSAGLAFAGLARAVLVLEARRGRLELTRHHGGYDRMPLLAVSFLVLGLACTGFPGTLGFVGQELLMHGAVDAFPFLGYAIVAASALTGVAVLRMYFSLFCGRTGAPGRPSPRCELTRREALAFAALLVVLLGFGLAPRPVVASCLRASGSIMRLRAARSSPTR